MGEKFMQLVILSSYTSHQGSNNNLMHITGSNVVCLVNSRQISSHTYLFMDMYTHSERFLTFLFYFRAFQQKMRSFWQRQSENCWALHLIPNKSPANLYWELKRCFSQPKFWYSCVSGIHSSVYRKISKSVQFRSQIARDAMRWHLY